MTLDPNLALAIVVPLVVGLVWLIRLEGRLNLNESRTNDLHGLLEEVRTDVKSLLSRRSS